MTKAYSISNDFPTATTAEGYDQWRALVDKLLAGERYGDKLCQKSEDGFLIDPAPKPAAKNTPHQKQSGDCLLTAFVETSSVDEANRELLSDLVGGAVAVHITLDMFGKRGRGVVINSADDFAKLLDGIYLEFIPISIDAGQAYTQATEMLMNEYQSRDIDPQKAVAHLNIPVTKNDVGLGHLISSVSVNLPNVTCVGVDGASAHNAGASVAQELGFMLASGVAALRCLIASDIAIDVAAKQITFRMALDSDVFMGMAKIRSLRHMWGEVLKASGAKNTDAIINVQTSKRMMSSVDIETNILRTTAASFAGLLGGADGLSVLPYDINATNNKDTSAKDTSAKDTSANATRGKARRIARNIAVILEEEAMLTRTHDVAAGSYSIEALAEQLSATAWGLFQQIEQAGGIEAALENGMIVKWFGQMAIKRQAEIAAGDITIVGVNEFLNPEEGNAS